MLLHHRGQNRLRKTQEARLECAKNGLRRLHQVGNFIQQFALGLRIVNSPGTRDLFSHGCPDPVAARRPVQEDSLRRRGLKKTVGIRNRK